MAKASINIQVAGGNSEKHMNRESKVTYLLDPNSKNNEYQTFKSSKDYLSAAKVATKEKTGRTMQKLAKKNFVQEAVLNLEENHTLNDVKKVFEDLQKEFGGFEVFKIAVHKDEGYFYHKNEELEYRPNRDIFYNEKDKKFYLDKNHTQKADLSKFEKRYNYHAHVLFTKFNMSQGKNARLNKSDMRKVQTITAKSLGMERGEEFSKAKRKSHWQLKESHDIKRDTKKEVLAKKKDIDDLKKELRTKMISEGGHTKEDYQALNNKFKELEEQVKTKDLTISELKEQNHALEAKISINPTPSTPKQENTALNDNFEELYANLKDHSRDWENVRTEKMFLERNINETLAKDIDQLVDKYISPREIKTKLGFMVEHVDVVDKKSLKEEIKELQKEHGENYVKFIKFLDLFSKPAKVVMKKIQEVQSKILKNKISPKKEKTKNQGFSR